jgi:hypothetical protein
MMDAATKINKVRTILLGYCIGDRVWAGISTGRGNWLEGPGTIVESRTAQKNPIFPWNPEEDGESVLIRFDAEPHDSGHNNGFWTAAGNIRPL